MNNKNTFDELLHNYSDKWHINFNDMLVMEQGPSPEPPSDEEIQPPDAPNNANTQPINPDNTELDPSIQQPDNSALPPLDQTDQTDTEQNPDNTISNERDVMLIKLIYKALTIDIDPSQYSDLLEIKEIDNKNASQVLEQLQQIINQY